MAMLERLKKRGKPEWTLARRLEKSNSMRGSKNPNFGKPMPLARKVLALKTLRISRAKLKKDHPEIVAATNSKISKSVIAAHAAGKLHTWGKGGHFYSYKNDKMLHYSSSYEKRFMNELEINPEVISYDKCRSSIEYELEGKIHRYLPDFVINWSNGLKEIIEVKPKCFIGFGVNPTKFAYAEPYCKSKGYEFRVVTEFDSLL